MNHRQRYSTRSSAQSVCTRPEDDEVPMNNENEIRVEAEIHPSSGVSFTMANLSTTSSRRRGQCGGRTIEPSGLRSGKSQMNKALAERQGRQLPDAAQAVRSSQVRADLESDLNEFDFEYCGAQGAK